MSVKLAIIPNIMVPAGRVDSTEKFREGMVVRDIVPHEYAIDRGLTIYRMRAKPGIDSRKVQLDEFVEDGDFYAISRRPLGPGVAAGAAVGGATAASAVASSGAITGALVGAAAAAPAAGFSIASIGKFLGLNAGLFFLQKILAPAVPSISDDEASATYGFGGIQGASAAGLTRPVLYGKHMTGGILIAEYTDSQLFPPRQNLWKLIFLSEGVVRSVAGHTVNTPDAFPLTSQQLSRVLINDNPATNFDEVEAWVRMGTKTQAPIPGFEKSPTLFFPAFELTQAVVTDTASNLQLIVDAANFTDTTGSVATAWAEHGQAFDLTSAIDSFSIGVAFDSLFQVGSGGAINVTTFTPVIRYIELDGGNNPITTGGPEGDGYVRLRPELTLTLSQRSAFIATWSKTLFDPSTYTHPTLGNSGDFAGGARKHTTGTSPGLPIAWSGAKDDPLDAFTFETWFNPATLGTQAFVAKQGAAAAQDYGWVIFIQSRLFGVGGSEPRFVPHMYGRGQNDLVDGFWPGKSDPITVPEYTLAAFNWFHLAVVYDDSTQFVTFYINGDFVGTEDVSSIGGFTIGTATHEIEICDNASGGAGPFTGKLDELRIWNRVLTAQEISQSYNSGRGSYGFQSGPPLFEEDLRFPDLVLGLHFDTAFIYNDAVTGVAGNDGALSDYSSYVNDITPKPANSPMLNAVGIVELFGTNTADPKRSKYRIEVMRANVKSDNASSFDRATWAELTAFLDVAFSYPSCALIALKIPANEQLNTNDPSVKVEVEGRKVPVWDNVDADNPNMIDTYSQDPAWIMCDPLLNEKYGAGEFFDAASIDVVQFKAWSDYNNQLVHNLDGVLDFDDGDFVNLFLVTADRMEIRAVDPDRITALDIKVGDRLGMTGMPAVAGGVLQDINTPDGTLLGSDTWPTGGYEVTSIPDSATAGKKDVWLDISGFPSDPWTPAGFITAVAGAPTLTGSTIEVRAVRHQFNGVFDTPQRMWEALIDIGIPGRGTPVPDGSGVTVRAEMPRSPVDIIGMSSVEDGSIEVDIDSPRNRPNQMTVEFLNGAINYEFDDATVTAGEIDDSTTLDAFRRETQFVKGISREFQALRLAQFRLNVNQKSLWVARFRSHIDSLALQVGDVAFLGHDAMDWNQSGFVQSNSASNVKVTLDTEVTLDAGVTYRIGIRDTNAAPGGGAAFIHKIVVTAAGTYPAGTELDVNAFPFTPAQGDRWLIYPAASANLPQYQAQLVGGTLDMQMVRSLEFAQYDADIYDDTPENAQLSQTQNSVALDAPDNPSVFPKEPRKVRVRASVDQNEGGGHTGIFDVSWEADPTTVQRIARTNLLLSEGGGPYELMTVVEGSKQRGQVVLPSADQTVTYRVAVQHETSSVAKKPPESCVHAVVNLKRSGPGMSAPTGLVGSMDREFACYSYTPADQRRDARLDIRSGGWILGQKLGIAARDAKKLGPTAAWIGNVDSTAQVFARHITQDERVGTATIVEFNPSVGDALAWDATTLNGVSQIWEDEATPFERTGAPPNATTLSGLTVSTDLEGDPFLEFTGGSLTGTWTTTTDILAVGTQKHLGFIEIYTEGYQVHPWQLGDWGALGEPEMQRWSFEGPTSLLPGEPANVTMQIKMKLDGDANYRDYEPGVYRFKQTQLQILFTRATSDYNFRIYKLHQKYTRAPRRIDQPIGRNLIVDARIFDED